MSYYITTPIYYPNSSPHIGTAYTTVLVDAMARLQRMKGNKVHFLTGTDENAQKIVRTAEKAGTEPQIYVDGIVEKFRGLWQLLDVQNDDFIRTTEKRHRDVVEKVFQKLYEQGDIYKSEYEGWYCTPCETFWPEKKLLAGKCPNSDCGRDVELLREESYFFRMSKYQDRLLQYIEDHPDFIQPVSRKNEMVRFVQGGLEDLCVSRTTFQWGIKVPFDEKHVVYVWLDALINYISALGYPDGELYQEYWPADAHVMGKDIVRFHGVIWPIILMALDIPLPKKIFGHGWFMSKEGGKISKSRGNVQDSFQLIERYGSDAIRYFLLREMQYGADGTYSEDDLVERINVDLANDLGNFVSRTLAMVVKYCQGEVPLPGPATDLDQEVRTLAAEMHKEIEAKLLACDPAGALESLWRFLARCNKYVDETAPWALAKDPEQQGRLHTVLYTFVESVRILGIFCQPFMPGVPRKLGQLLHSGKDLFSDWNLGGEWGILPVGMKVEKGEALFPRIDVAQFEEKEPVEEALAVPVQTMEPLKEMINIEDFAKLDLRVVTVLRVEKVPKTDKLLRLEVDMGGEMRTVVSGIAQHYRPEDLIGKKVVLVANLKPVKLRGIVSQGMILATSADDVLEVLTLAKEVKSGAVVR